MIAWQKFETEIEGDQITMEIRPLKRKHYVVMTAMVDMDRLLVGKTQEELTEALNTDKELGDKMMEMTFKLQETGSEAMTECVRGLKIGDEEIPSAELGEEMTYTKLALVILRKLTEISSLTGEQRKNSQGPSSVAVMEGSTLPT